MGIWPSIELYPQLEAVHLNQCTTLPTRRQNEITLPIIQYYEYYGLILWQRLPRDTGMYFHKFCIIFLGRILKVRCFYFTVRLCMGWGMEVDDIR